MTDLPTRGTLPVIDVAGLGTADAAERRRVAAELGRACREVGFFAIVGHGVAPLLMADAFAASHEFFAQPADFKQALAIGRLGGNRGYVGLGVEALDEHAAPDHKEALNLIWTDGGRTRPANVWPDLPRWRERLQACFDALLAVGRTLHAGFAIDLELPEDFFADKLDRPQAAMRLLRYPAGDVAHEAGGAGTHTDYGNVTLLATDGVAGLQVQRRDGVWIDAPHVPGGLICNIGDCLMRWTNDIYVSTPHRVLRPPRERYSIAVFVDPNPDALVSAIPQCVVPGEAPRHAPIRAADHLAERLAATYGARAG